MLGIKGSRPHFCVLWGPHEGLENVVLVSWGHVNFTTRIRATTAEEKKGRILRSRRPLPAFFYRQPSFLHHCMHRLLFGNDFGNTVISRKCQQILEKIVSGIGVCVPVYPSHYSFVLNSKPWICEFRDLSAFGPWMPLDACYTMTMS